MKPQIKKTKDVIKKNQIKYFMFCFIISAKLIKFKIKMIH